MAARLERAAEMPRAVRLEFAGGIVAEIARREFEPRKDNKDWLVEFPPQALRVLWMPLKSFDEYVALAGAGAWPYLRRPDSGTAPGDLRAETARTGRPLGRHRKRLVTFIEIDRCATDAIPVVTGCRLGKRALKFRDFGKVAATFCDLEADRAVRVVALEHSKQRAQEMFPEIADKNAQQMRAYRELPDGALFSAEWVRVRLGPEEFPGYKAARVACAECGEGINFKREVVRDGRVLCKACAGERYYEPL